MQEHLQDLSNPVGSDSGKDDAVTTFSISPGFGRRLFQGQFSFAFTSYQSGGLYLVGLGLGTKSELNIHQAAVSRPMGIAVNDAGGFVLSGRVDIQCFSNGLNPDQRVNEHFDACYVPRLVHITGALDAHDVGVMADGTPIFVNTRYNCLAVPDPRHSFVPIWRPPFISAMVAEDRCHLNGLAMRDGAPAFVTAVSCSDTIDGWRDRRTSGGIIVDVASNEVIASGLSMPHSPRWYRDQLWVLNSGTGELGTISRKGDTRDRFTPVAFCPGFVRGLAFAGKFAFVGLSRPRYQRFEGLELDRRLAEKDSEAWCGVQVIDLDSGSCVDWLRMDGAVGEIYDVAILPGVRTPMAIGVEAPEINNYITIGQQQ